MNNSFLENEQVNALNKFFRLTTEKSSTISSIKGLDLTDEVKCNEYLEGLRCIFPNASKRVVASQFSKRYGYLSVAPSLYSVTLYNKGLDFSIENINVESNFKEENWLPYVRLNHLSVSISGLNRQAWLYDMTENIFAKTYQWSGKQSQRLLEFLPQFCGRRQPFMYTSYTKLE